MKPLWVTQFIISMKDIGFKYNRDFDIAQSFDLKIIFERANYTPLMENNYVSKYLDFTDLDIS